MTSQEYEKILKRLNNLMDNNCRKIINLVDDVIRLKNALKFIDKHNSDLYNNAIKYANEIEEGCI